MADTPETSRTRLLAATIDLVRASGYAATRVEDVCAAAGRNRCDLILMATHGRRGISRLLLGSETSKVLSHTKVTVIVCR